MTVNTLVEIDVTKQPLLTNTTTGKQNIRLTLDEARDLYNELVKLFEKDKQQPALDVKGVSTHNGFDM